MRNSLFVSFLFILFISINVSAGNVKLKENFEIAPNCKFIWTDNKKFLSAFLVIYEQEPDFHFVVFNYKNNNYYIGKSNFIYVKKNSDVYPLVNFYFSFLSFNNKTVPYIHPVFLIKYLFILKDVNKDAKITDAFRTYDEQQLYLRRKWTDVDISPHLIGLAADLVFYTKNDIENIERISRELFLKNLVHGSKGNRHQHLQDNRLWLGIQKDEIPLISDKLSKSADSYNLHIIKPDYAFEAEYFPATSKFNFYFDKSSVLKIIFENLYGVKKAEINAGVFEEGNSTVFLNTNFLKEGFYKMKIYINDYFFREIFFAVK